MKTRTPSASTASTPKDRVFKTSQKIRDAAKKHYYAHTAECLKRTSKNDQRYVLESTGDQVDQTMVRGTGRNAWLIDTAGTKVAKVIKNRTFRSRVATQKRKAAQMTDDEVSEASEETFFTPPTTVIPTYEIAHHFTNNHTLLFHTRSAFKPYKATSLHEAPNVIPEAPVNQMTDPQV